MQGTGRVPLTPPWGFDSFNPPYFPNPLVSHQLPCLSTHRPPPLFSAATTLGSLASLESHHNKSVGGGDPSDGICTRRRKHRSTEVEKAEVTLSKWRHRLPWPVQSLLGPQLLSLGISSTAWGQLNPAFPQSSSVYAGFTLFKISLLWTGFAIVYSVHACVFLSLLYVSVLRGGVSSGGHLI